MPNQIYTTGMKRIVLTLICSLFLSPFVFAQEKEENVFPDSEEIATEVSEKSDRNTVTNIPESTIVEDKHAGEYLQSTVENISKLKNVAVPVIPASTYALRLPQQSKNHRSRSVERFHHARRQSRRFAS